ncbi:MAG: tetratricopeptide repeat protein [Nitrospinae bacterium]|nr:tetratricopeptide repeat protein [Nitrospinota bacterium]
MKYSSATFSRTKAAILFSILAFSACSQVSQKELQEAVNPLNGKKYPLAIAKLSRLAEKYPANAQVNYYLGYAYLKNDDFRKALLYVDRAVESNGSYNAPVGDTGMANFLAGNSQSSGDPYFRLAVLEMEKILSKVRGTIDADRIQYHLAHFYLIKKDYKNAVPQFEKTIASPPDRTEFDAQARLALGRIYLDNLEDEGKGRTEIQLLIDQYPQSMETAEGLFILAEFYEKQTAVFGKRRDSLREFARKWKDDALLGKEVPAALEQAQKDSLAFDEFKIKAGEGYKKIVANFPNSPFFALAQARLSKL